MPYLCPLMNPCMPGDVLDPAAAFSPVPGYDLGQSWRPDCDPAFRPGRVQMGWDGEALQIFADLVDEELVSPEGRSYQPAFLSGDTFEIFLQADGEERYHEIHVGPLGQLFQLQFPSEEIFQRLRNTEGFTKTFLVNKPLLTREVRILPESERWQIHCRLPLAPLQDGRIPASGDQWKLSFCRYDYAFGETQAVYSSTAALSKPDFHRLGEWPVFTLE